MTLRERQAKLARMVSALIQVAFEMGYEVTLGDAYRDPKVHGEFGTKLGYGHASSLHKKRLAVDLNLFKDGRYITGVEGHAELGEVWKKMGGTWGGDFKIKDFNHYELKEK